MLVPVGILTCFTHQRGYRITVLLWLPKMQIFFVYYAGGKVELLINLCPLGYKCQFEISVHSASMWAVKRKFKGPTSTIFGKWQCTSKMCSSACQCVPVFFAVFLQNKTTRVIEHAFLTADLLAHCRLLSCIATTAIMCRSLNMNGYFEAAAIVPRVNVFVRACNLFLKSLTLLLN